MESGLLGEEEVGTLDDGLEVGLAIGVKELGNVGDVDRLGLKGDRKQMEGDGSATEGQTQETSPDSQ